MKKYNVPPWAHPEPRLAGPWSLEVMKDGVIIQKIDLISKNGDDENKSYFICGRQPDIVDIQMDHSSLSRQHAVLQIRDDGALMILDWNSAQGTTVNKAPLNRDEYRRLYVGDLIRFGASTRMYIVCGPDDQGRSEMEITEKLESVRQKVNAKSVKLLEEKIKKEYEGISWGFGDDAENEDDDEGDEGGGLGNGLFKGGGTSKMHSEVDEEDLPDYIKNDPNRDRKYNDKFQVNINDDNVNEKDRGILEKIRVKERKIQNMQEEIKRIYLKEGSQESGLTEGQLAAVSRNDSRIEQLKEQIQQLVSQIKDKNLQRAGSSMLSKGGGGGRRGGKKARSSC